MRTSTVVVTAAALVATAACGQKPGVAEQPLPPQPVTFALPSGAFVDPETGQIVDSEGNVIGGLESHGASLGQGGAPATATAGTTTGDSGGPTGDASGGGPTHSDTSRSAVGDTTGLTAQTIKIGAHAPLTGAAPIPSDSAYKGNALYWKWLDEIGKTINGRRVEAVLENDNYNPSQAVAACKEMVEKDEVFLLYGFAGTDQIQACARYASSVGVPYVSVGATEAGLRGLPGYFAITLSYAEQGSLLADLLTSRLGAKRERNGMLRFDTPNFQDAHDAFVREMDNAGASVHYDRAVSKSAGDREAQVVVQEMKSRGIENVYVLTSPVWFLRVLQAARAQSYEPQWVGVGITKAIDTVASVGCRNGTLSRAKFFSPFPAWADINDFDRDFQRAVAAIYPEEDRGDDVMVIAWGFTKVLAKLLERAGRDLTRKGFLESTARARDVRTGVYPPVTFSPSDQFGGTQVHLNEAHCSGYKSGDNRWHTIESFARDF